MRDDRHSGCRPPRAGTLPEDVAARASSPPDGTPAAASTPASPAPSTGRPTDRFHNSCSVVIGILLHLFQRHWKDGEANRPARNNAGTSSSACFREDAQDFASRRLAERRSQNDIGQRIEGLRPEPLAPAVSSKAGRSISVPSMSVAGQLIGELPAGKQAGLPRRRILRRPVRASATRTEAGPSAPDAPGSAPRRWRRRGACAAPEATTWTGRLNFGDSPLG